MENTTAVEALVWLEQELTGSGIAFEQVQHANNRGQTRIKSELTLINLYKLVHQTNKYGLNQLLF